MVDRIPSGTRDVLPDEMRELRAMTDRMRAVFERAGYGEVYTPALEYETHVRAREHARAAGPRTGCSTSRATCSCCAPT